MGKFALFPCERGLECFFLVLWCIEIPLETETEASLTLGIAYRRKRIATEPIFIQVSYHHK